MALHLCPHPPLPPTPSSSSAVGTSCVHSQAQLDIRPAQAASSATQPVAAPADPPPSMQPVAAPADPSLATGATACGTATPPTPTSTPATTVCFDLASFPRPPPGPSFSMNTYSTLGGLLERLAATAAASLLAPGACMSSVQVCATACDSQDMHAIPGAQPRRVVHARCAQGGDAGAAVGKCSCAVAGHERVR